MADYIFSKGVCQKKDLYQTMIDLLLSAGWENVSSRPQTDFDVLYSKGEDGDKNLFFNFRPTNTSNTNNTQTTDYNACSFRLINGYTAGKPNESGTFERPNESWRNFYLAPTTTTIPLTTEVTYYYHVNKNRLIFIIIYPEAINVDPITHYIGLPDEVYIHEPDSRGLLHTSSAYASTGNGVLISDNAHNLTSATSAQTRNFYITLSPRNPNSDGIYMLSEAKYGNTTEGLRGKLTGLYFLPNENVHTGNIIQIGEKNFMVVVNGSGSTNGLPSYAVAFQI